MYKIIVELLSVIKNKIVVFIGKWMNLEVVMLSKVSQAQEDTQHIFSCMLEGRERGP